MDFCLWEFRELSDEEWAFIELLPPPKARTGRPRVDDRAVLNGLLYVLITGCRWMDMPPSMVQIRLLGIGLAGGLRQGCGSAYLKLDCGGMLHG